MPAQIPDTDPLGIGNMKQSYVPVIITDEVL